MDLIERLIDEADGYGDGPVVVHDIEGLRALLCEAAAALEAARETRCTAPPSAPVGVEARWYRYNKPAPRWEDTKFGKWLDPAVYGPPREQHGYSLEVATLSQQPAPVAPVGVEGLVGLMREVIPALRATGVNVTLADDVEKAAALAQQPPAVDEEEMRLTYNAWFRREQGKPHEDFWGFGWAVWKAALAGQQGGAK